MATLNNIADFLADRLGRPFDDFLKVDLKFAVKYWRAFLIRQDVERNGTSREFLQRFILPLVKVDKADSCAIDIGCLVLKTGRLVPKPVRLKQPVPFKYVGEVGGDGSWTHTELEELQFTKENKYTSNVIRYNYINNLIYVYGNIRVKFVAIEGVFANPEEAIDYCVGSADCVTDDEPFPIGEDMLKTLMDGILKGEFNIKAPIEKQDVEVTNDNDR